MLLCSIVINVLLMVGVALNVVLMGLGAQGSFTDVEVFR